MLLTPAKQNAIIIRGRPEERSHTLRVRQLSTIERKNDPGLVRDTKKEQYIDSPVDATIVSIFDGYSKYYEAIVA